MWKYSPVTTVVLLGPMVFTFALGMDVYMPVVPKIVENFATTPFMVQLTLSLFMLLTGLGQLIVGPLSDQYGRRRLMLAAAALFATGSLLCALSTGIAQLITFRIIQAIGACGTLVVAFAIVRDAFSETDSAQVYSFLNGTISISPLLGPIIGVWLDVTFNWRAPFGFLFILGVITLSLVVFMVQESLPPGRRMAVSAATLLRHYSIVCRNLQFVTYALCSAAGMAAFFTFFSMTPYIISEQLGLPEVSIGFYFGLGGMSFMAGCLCSGFVVKKLGVMTTASTGVAFLMLSGLSMLAWHLLFGLTLWGFVGPAMIFTFGCALAAGAGAGGAMAPFGAMAGTASAMFGAVEFTLSALLGSVVMLWPVANTLPLAIELLTTSGIAGILLIALKLQTPQRLNNTASTANG